MEPFSFLPRDYYYPRNRYFSSFDRRVQNPYIENQRRNREKWQHREKENEKVQDIEKQQNRGDSKKTEKPIFEIFGLQLFFDDILIMALIFFLYNEGVRDNLLFISLILILLS